MTELDPSQINKFILNAALREEPIFVAYKKLCTIQENPQMDYKDFERAYYQFYHGNYDVTIEKSLPNSSPLTLSDLPKVFLENIVKELNLVDCLILRKVSHSLRNLVDSTEVYGDYINFQCYDSYLKTTIGDLRIEYHKTKDGRCNVLSQFDGMKLKEYNDDRSYQHVMLADALTFLKHPKLQMEIFGLTADNNEALYEFLKNLWWSRIFHLDCQSVNIRSHGHFVSKVLELFKPERLEQITLCSVSTVDHIEEVVKTEQWKKTETLCWEEAPGRFQFRLHQLLPFTNICSYSFEFTDENLNVVRDLLLKSTRLDRCFFKFSSSHPFGDYEDGKERIENIMGQTLAFDSETWRFSIPNSRDYFQLKFVKNGDHLGSLVIEKTVSEI